VRTAAFPPYDSFRRLEEAASVRQEKLARIYSLGHHQAWDGQEVLSELVRRHGKPDLPPDLRDSLTRIFAIIFWGELAAWNVSSEIAVALDDTEAKMAATSQAFDEARHFTVMREYLRLLGGPPPELDGYSHAILTELLETDSLLKKLVGMQLLVENIALVLFRAVADARPEPVLGDLMPYFERDEARHVGLGVLELPRQLARVGRAEAAALVLTQVKINTMVGWGSILQRHDFERAGLELNYVMHGGFGKQMEIGAMVQRSATVHGGSLRGVDRPPPSAQAITRYTIDAFFPQRELELHPWHHRALWLVEKVARVGERALRLWT
jgi:hypothetical protein